MDRETRKASLKKLSLSGVRHVGESGSQNLRKTRSVHPTISKYFITPKSSEVKKTITDKEMNRANVNEFNAIELLETDRECSSKESNSRKVNTKSTKRTKLTDFVFKENGEENARELFDLPDKDTFEMPKKKVNKANKHSKKASKFSKLRRSDQRDIKTSLLRSEHAFSEIASQHCRVDNFSTDEIVLALALSKSEIENSEPIFLEPERKDVDRHYHDELKNIPKILQQYGFRINSSEDYRTLASMITPGANRRNKTKWANKFTALTLRDSNLQTKKIESKINSLMAQQFDWNKSKQVKIYSLISDELQKLETADAVRNKLETKEECNMEEYYVKSLFEVACAQAGCLLKDWHSIQGRDKSPREGKIQIGNTERQMDLIYRKLEDYFEFENKANQSPHRNETLQNKEKKEANEVIKYCSTLNTASYFLPHINNDDQRTSLSSESSGSYIKYEQLLHNNIDSNSCDKISKRVEVVKHSSEEFDRNLNFSSSLQNISDNRTSNSTRNLSPNIFASSDEESEEVSSKITGTDSHQQEFYAKSEVSTDIPSSYVTVDELGVTSEIVDLTLEIISEHADKSNDLASNQKGTPSKSEKEAYLVMEKTCSLDNLASKAMETKVKTPMIDLMNYSVFSPITDEIQSFACTNTEPSVNIVQNEEMDDCEDCIVLSDDEINYSIWKADMSRAREEEKCRYIKSEIENSGKDDDSTNNDLIFHFMDGVDYTSNNTNKEMNSKMNSFTYDLDRERFNVPCSSKLTDRSNELLEFGILDNTSEPYTQTCPNFKTSSQDASIKCDSTPSQNMPIGLGELLTADMDFKKSNGDITYTSTLSHATLLELCAYPPDEYEIAGRTYATRIVTGPKPDFTQQNEPDLLKQLYEFGIKPLKRKQAVKILEYIYNSTHPLIQAESPELSMSSKDEIISKDAIDIEPDGNIIRATSHAASSPTKLQLKDCLCPNMLHFSKEMLLNLEYENYIFQTNVTKKTPRPLLPLHIAWYNLVTSNTILHEMILRYKPIDLHDIYVFFKQIGCRFEPKDMKAFLDRRCIIFRYDMTNPTRPNERHILKRKSKDKHKIFEI